MRKRRLKKLWRRLHELQQQNITRDTLLLKIGAAKKEAGRAYFLVTINLPKADEPVNRDTFSFRLHKKKLREVRRREGCYLIPPRHTQPDRDMKLLLAQLKLILPKQPPPKIVAGSKYLENARVVPTHLSGSRKIS